MRRCGGRRCTGVRAIAVDSVDGKLRLVRCEEVERGLGMFWKIDDPEVCDQAKERCDRALDEIPIESISSEMQFGTDFTLRGNHIHPLPTPKTIVVIQMIQSIVDNAPSRQYQHLSRL